MLLFILLLVFIIIAVALAWFLIAHDHGEMEPIGVLWLSVGLGFLGAMAASRLESMFVNANHLQATADTLSILVAATTVGVIEELCKFLPLAVFLYRKRYFNEHTDGIIYFALAGLGFGLPENILYTLQYGTQAGIGRIILTPFFHAAITALVGYFLIKGKLARKSLLSCILALVAAMLLHALYDFGLVSGRATFSLMSVGVTLSLSGALFVLFVRATERDQDRGLSAVGHNAYCRSCGAPNPRRHLYCTRCGKNA